MPRKKSNELNQMTFEDAFAEMEKICLQLENNLEGQGLDEAIEKFTKGMKLSQFCLERLEKAEKIIDTVIKEVDGKLIEQPLKMED